MLRITYLQNLEHSILELTKKRVASLRDILGETEALNELKTTEEVFEKLIQLSNPIEFEGEARDQAMKRLKELFQMSIWYQFAKPNINDFGGRYTQELNEWESLQATAGDDDASKQARNKGMLMRCHMIRIVVKFVQDQLRKPVEQLHKQSVLLNIESTQIFLMDELIDSLLEHKTYRKAKKPEEQKENEAGDADAQQIDEADAALPDFITHTENQNLQDLQAHLQDIFTQGDNKEAIEQSFKTKIGSQLLKDLICYTVWNRKGRLEGIHPDFGFLSYIRSAKISGHYHVNDDDRVELLLDLSEKLNHV